MKQTLFILMIVSLIFDQAKGNYWNGVREAVVE